MSKFGSRVISELNPTHMMNRRNTSSLVNQILNKNHNKPKKAPQSLFKKNGKKK